MPYAYGLTDASVVFSFLYARAEDNFQLIEDNYIRALGRASEVHGEKKEREAVPVQKQVSLVALANL